MTHEQLLEATAKAIFRARAQSGRGVMAVYVDDMCDSAMGRYRRMKMSHMIADSEQELHAMADQIGVARRWFQGDHYDICKSKREKAFALGAQPVTMRELVSIRRRIATSGR